MESPQNKLFEAAAKGCVISLQQLLIDDPLILDRVIINHYSETPLHVAAMLGHIDFVNEIIHMKPQLTNELNSQLSSPLHLASAKGHVDVVRALLAVDHHTCLACDSNGLTPLHLAAIKGRDEVMELLLQAQPDAARLTSYGDGTILHLCVKNHQLEALKRLLTAVSEPEFVNSSDADGNTVLHLAVGDKQVETTKLLLNVAALEVNALNHEGMTAMDVLIRSRRDVRDSEITESLEQAGGTRAALEVNPLNHEGITAMDVLIPSRRDVRDSEITESLEQAGGTRAAIETNTNTAAGDGLPIQVNDWLDEKKNALMLVATLNATMAFQIGVSPPGGVWQDDNFLINSHGHMVDPNGNTNISQPVNSTNDVVLFPHQAGCPVLERNAPFIYMLFYISNTIGFFFSVGIIFMLMSGFHSKNRYFVLIMTVVACIAISATASTYFSAVIGLTALRTKELKVEKFAVFAWCGLTVLVIIFQAVRFFVKPSRRPLQE
ncbi:hypothetical protein C2S53_012238 [Perilla frutescens var. hirtella]|uniref:PGG domain-containing protein n=1 Tax=Perilla frutescens var. hirtella TaxID=608512 RepID=A0AAD4J320_PERFH|nr:hypothetical protein C2S53_012238 [Perilla frutescens var. hirtella]